MEIDLTQSDEETSVEVTPPSPSPGFVSFHLNATIDRVWEQQQPSSSPPPLEPIDLSDRIRSNRSSREPAPTRRTWNKQQCVYTCSTTTRGAQHQQPFYHQQQRMSTKEHRSYDCIKPPPRPPNKESAALSIKSTSGEVVAPAALNSSVYYAIHSLPPPPQPPPPLPLVGADERTEAVKSAFTPYRSATDRNNQFNSFATPAPVNVSAAPAKPGAFYHKWKLPMAPLTPRPNVANDSIKKSQLGVADNNFQIATTSAGPVNGTDEPLTVRRHLDLTVIRRITNTLADEQQTTSSSSKSSTNGSSILSNYKPLLKLKKEPDGIRMKWSLPTVDGRGSEVVAGYELEMSSHPDDGTTGDDSSTSRRQNVWKKLGIVKALPLPMGCSLSKFTNGYRYHFRMRSLLRCSDASPYSEPNSVLF